jgi:hypothetical protein
MFILRDEFTNPYYVMIEETTSEKFWDHFSNFRLKDAITRKKLLDKSPEEQRAFVLAAAIWLEIYGRQPYDTTTSMVRTAMMTLLRHRLPFNHEDVNSLLAWSILQPSNYQRGVPQMIKIVEDYLKDHELTSALRENLEKLSKVVDSEYSNAETRRWVSKLQTMMSQNKMRMPLVEGEAWVEQAIADLNAADETVRIAWLELLNLCLKASGSSPSDRWLKSAEKFIEKIGQSRFTRNVAQWFSLVDKPRTRRIETWSQWQPDPNQMITPVNADILRGLAWLCAIEENRETARALTALAISAYRKVPNIGPRCVRLGNACVWALGHMPGTEGIGQLALLKLKVKFGTAQKGIASALTAAAKSLGLPPEEIEEMSVPTYGLEEVGIGRKQFGEYTAELTVTGTKAAELCWIKPDGKKQTSVPQAVKTAYAEGLKEISQAVKDIRKMLPAQLERIENLYLEQKRWAMQIWRERYLNHPLIGTLARRIIWQFTSDARTETGIWHGGQIVGRDGRALDWLDDRAQVELWHPIYETTETILAWRDWLAAREIQQPFKQAYREIYLLTDAERTTRTYSNRFAAHIIKQHQFNALCGVRGWTNQLRLMVDSEYPPAMRIMRAWGLRAEFWVEGIGDNYGTDTTDAGTYLYLTTDQVRFYPIDAQDNYAHADGGGYHGGYFYQNSPIDPLPLEQIPPLVLSEIMRDVDLFVGVGSVAGDPSWADGGPRGRYQDYWASYSFGDLSETAKTRKQVLNRLIPHLKIADRCQVTDKFLVVRGDIRTYKIHLGSGNILMEPNDKYLCIVQARGESTNGAEKVWLPFEGDNRLTVILSKAFLLADDRSIKDPTILRQIRG